MSITHKIHMANEVGRGVYCMMFTRGQNIKSTISLDEVTCLGCLRWFGMHEHGNKKTKEPAP